MSYQYQVSIKPIDLWVLSMRRTYRSVLGVCNIVFGIAMILLAVRFWDQSNDVVQAVLFLACLLMPVIQPLGVYWKAKAQVAVIPQGTNLLFSEDGIHVTLGEENEFIQWNKVKGVKKDAGMVIVFTGAGHGYMLTNRVLGSQKSDFYRYVKKHIQQTVVQI